MYAVIDIGGKQQIVKKGDEVVLIGHQEDREISVASFADRTKSFNYETLVRLDESISRQVVPGRPTPPS